MKNRVKCLFISMFFILCPAWSNTNEKLSAPLSVESEIVQIPRPTLRFAPKFKSVSLRDRVFEALQLSKQDDLSLSTELVRIYNKKPDLMLSEVALYLNDTDDDIRFAVIDIASAFKTERALSMLMSLLDDAVVGHMAAKKLYLRYSTTELLTRGGSRLKNALLRASIRNRYAKESVLMLSLYKGDQKILNFLNNRRVSYIGSKLSAESHSVELMSVDLALAEIGDSASQKRISLLFSQKKISDILALLGQLKFVNSKKVLLPIVALLKDKSKARLVGFEDSPSTLRYTRLCDEALVVLAEKTGYKIRPFYDAPPAFSNKELSDAYSYFQALFNKEIEMVKQ